MVTLQPTARALPPHPWDTAARRAVIHAAFDRAAAACADGVGPKAIHLVDDLRQLIIQAYERRLKLALQAAKELGS